MLPPFSGSMGWSVCSGPPSFGRARLTRPPRPGLAVKPARKFEVPGRKVSVTRSPSVSTRTKPGTPRTDVPSGLAHFWFGSGGKRTWMGIYSASVVARPTGVQITFTLA